MSLRESLDELTRLTPAERRLLCRRALAVDEADEIAALAHTAAEGFALLDRMEAGDAAPVVKAGVGEEKPFSRARLAEAHPVADACNGCGVFRLNGFHAGRFADPVLKSAAGARAALALWGEGPPGGEGSGRDSAEGDGGPVAVSPAEGVAQLRQSHGARSADRTGSFRAHPACCAPMTRRKF